MTAESHTRRCRFLSAPFNVSVIWLRQIVSQISHDCFFVALCATLVTLVPATVHAAPPDSDSLTEALSAPFPDLSEDEADSMSGLDQFLNLSDDKSHLDDPARDANEDAVNGAVDPTDSRQNADIDLHPIGGSDEFPPISSLRPSTILSEGKVPENTGKQGILRSGTLSFDLSSRGDQEQLTQSKRRYQFYHAPLYFEDAELERCGRSFGAFQPVISAAHFFGTLPLVPYKMVNQPPTRAVRTLGDCRTCGRYCCRDNFLPSFDGTAALFEAGAITGLIFLVP